MFNNFLDSQVSYIKKLWFFLPKRRRNQFFLILLIMIIASFSEVISIGAIIPFLGIITSPDVVFQHVYMQGIIETLKIDNPQQLILPLTIIFILAALFAGLIRLILLYTMTRFSYAVGADLSIDIYRKTLYQDYSTHISRNSSEIISGIITKTETVVSGIVSPFLILISSLIIMVGIISALFMIDSVTALVALFGFGSIYWMIIKFTKKRLVQNSRWIAEESEKLIKLLQEGLGGIRDVIIDGNQEFYCNIYRKSDLKLRRSLSSNAFISASPRFIMEALGMTLIACLAYALSFREYGIASAIPVLGALALGGQRLLPALQQAYGAITGIKGSQESFYDVLKLLSQKISKNESHTLLEPISFQQDICLKNLSFKYTINSPWVLKKINVKFYKGKMIGIVGPTGSGKSTLLDIVMGLLLPTRGHLEIDNKILNERNLQSWQTHIAHVPQFVYLTDSSIKENIAFGIPKENIDINKVKQAAKKAQLSELIETFPKKYNTNIGERGVKLSGGQRQRLGIARALYRNADVIIFDEATSALDSDTENFVMEAIENLKDNITIIIIAHRITTLKKCNEIIELGNGGISRIVAYKELMNNFK